MFSGLPSSRACLRAISASCSSTSAGISSSLTYKGDMAAICSASSCANSRKASERATKSVSLLISNITPTRPSPCEYSSITPSEASRPARLAAFANPFSRRMSTALSKSPSACSRALRQSINPAPVAARISLICSVVTAMFD